MKTFELPVSDCECFYAGLMEGLPSMPEIEPGKELPKFGVVVWYSTPEAARAAAQAATKAHW